MNRTTVNEGSVTSARWFCSVYECVRWNSKVDGSNVHGIGSTAAGWSWLRRHRWQAKTSTTKTATTTTSATTTTTMTIAIVSSRGTSAAVDDERFTSVTATVVHFSDIVSPIVPSAVRVVSIGVEVFAEVILFSDCKLAYIHKPTTK